LLRGREQKDIVTLHENAVADPGLW